MNDHNRERESEREKTLTKEQIVEDAAEEHSGYRTLEFLNISLPQPSLLLFEKASLFLFRPAAE